MSTQREVTLYSFSELSESIQKSLIESFEVHDLWDDPVIDMIEQEAEEMGIDDFQMQYSGFWSQGDGLSFTGTLSDSLVEKIYKEKVNRDGFSKDNESFSVSFRRIMHTYVHEKTVMADIEDADSDYADIFEEVFNDWKDDLCSRWYNFLKECYETQTSEDYIREHYEDCGTVFLSDGRIL